MKPILLVITVLMSLTGFAKDFQYVCSENGVEIKSKPSLDAKTIAVANYATEVTLLENVASENNSFSKVAFYINMQRIEGYVESAELTAEKLEKRFKVTFNDAIIYIQNIQLNSSSNIFETDDSVTIDLYGESSPFKKSINVQTLEGYTVKIYQQSEQGFVFYSNNSFCKLDAWKTFKSDWKEMPQLIQPNNFSSLADEDFVDISTISVAEIQSAIRQRCQESVVNEIQPMKSLKENNMGLQTKIVRYKIELTDSENNITEKIIKINLSIGC